MIDFNYLIQSPIILNLNDIEPERIDFNIAENSETIIKILHSPVDQETINSRIHYAVLGTHHNINEATK